MCRKHAPTPQIVPDAGPFIGHGNLRAYWPYTRSTDGCSEGVSVVSVSRPENNQNADPPDKMKDMLGTMLKRPPTFNDIVQPYTASTIPTVHPTAQFMMNDLAVVDGGRRCQLIWRSLLTRTAGASEVMQFSWSVNGYFE